MRKVPPYEEGIAPRRTCAHCSASVRRAPTASGSMDVQLPVPIRKVLSYKQGDGHIRQHGRAVAEQGAAQLADAVGQRL